MEKSGLAHVPGSGVQISRFAWDASLYRPGAAGGWGGGGGPGGRSTGGSRAAPGAAPPAGREKPGLLCRPLGARALLAAPRAHLRRRRGDRASRQGRAPKKRCHPTPPAPRQSPRLQVPRERSRAASVYWGCFKITAARALTASSPPHTPRRHGAGSGEHLPPHSPCYLPPAVWKGGQPCCMNGGKGDFLNFVQSAKLGPPTAGNCAGRGSFHFSQLAIPTSIHKPKKEKSVVVT